VLEDRAREYWKKRLAAYKDTNFWNMLTQAIQDSDNPLLQTAAYAHNSALRRRNA